MIRAEDIHINKNCAIPLYEQLRSQLMKAIEDGMVKAGDKLPTEEELCAVLGISRPVVQAACNVLIREGYVERMRGKGTFVRIPDKRGTFLNRQISFAREMEILGLAHTTRVESASYIECPRELYGLPGMEAEDLLFHLVRMRYVNNQPFVLIENNIPKHLFPGIDSYDFGKQSLYDVFEKEYGILIHRSKRTILAQLAGTEASRHLEIRKGAPILVVENIVYDQMDRIIDHSREYLDAAKRQFTFDVYNR